MRTRPICGSLAAACVALSPLSAWAQGQPGEQAQITIQPVVLDASNSTGATVGLQWTAGKDYALSDGPDVTKPTNKDSEIRQLSASWKSSGTATADKERNPKNFLDLLGDLKYGYYRVKHDKDDRDAYAVAGGLFGKFEADQGFDNRQVAYGLRLTTWNVGLLKRTGARDRIAFDVNLGEVDPSKDAAREAALGTSTLEKFYRWDFELAYQYVVAHKELDRVEFNYRYFRENSPPEAVRAAGLHQFRLGTVRAVLKNDFFIAYSRGKLPFDRESQKIFEIGWSTNLDVLK